ncbi:regucalcin [Parasteatoda tepidariorum]|uniref:regucalcin n=1 Tax=Parasteatoda tepidariorum TaxID=114398 RepID=UPI0039BC65B5
MSVTKVSDRLSDLGEGPHWDVNSQRLYHVDAFVGEVCRLDPVTGITESVDLDGIVTFVIPFRSDPSNLLITLTQEVRKLNFGTGESEVLTQLSHDNPKYRFNDGKCDTKGRLWTGTLIPGEADQGHLYKMDKTYNLQQVEDKITLSNGLAWSLNNDTLYYIDSEARKINVFDFNLHDGTATNRRILIDYNVDEDYKELGYPDGMTIDIEGKLWVANYAGGCVIRIDPETKTILRRFDIPAKNVTSCCFGGPHFDILYVTTAKSAEDEGNYPDAGAVFAITAHGTRGQPPNHFST